MSLESLKPSLGFGGAGLTTRLPKILDELQGLTFSGPLTGAAAGTAIAVTDGIDIQDTIVKALIEDATSGVTAAGTLSDISITDRRATGTITCAGIVAGDKVAVNGKTYTAVAFTSTPTNSAVGPYNFAVGASNAATAANLAAAIMSGDSTLTAAVLSGAIVTIIFQTAGVGGNAVTLDISLSNAHATRSGATLAGGTATNSIKFATTDTTGKTVLLIWYKKSRVVGQF